MTQIRHSRWCRVCKRQSHKFVDHPVSNDEHARRKSMASVFAVCGLMTTSKLVARRKVGRFVAFCPNSEMLPLFDDVSATTSVGGHVRTASTLRAVEPVRGYRGYFLCPQTKLISGEMSCRSTFRVVVALRTP
jgi:hypothetical protein